MAFNYEPKYLLTEEELRDMDIKLRNKYSFPVATYDKQGFLVRSVPKGYILRDYRFYNPDSQIRKGDLYGI